MANPHTYPNVERKSLLPRTKTDFEEALEGIFQYNIYPVEDGHIYNPVLRSWDPVKIDAKLIPYLAQNLGLDIDENLTEEQQRAIICCAWDLHQYSGTPHVILEIIRALGYPGVSIREGVQGHWANYEIVLSRPISQIDGKSMLRLIKSLSPVRSVLVGIDVTQGNILYDGAAMWDGTYTFGTITASGINV